MFLVPDKLPQELTKKDIVKRKYKVSVVINPLPATMAKHK
jgi:hypothetical protein